MRRPSFILGSLAAAALLSLMISTARADDVAAADGAAIHQIVEDQLAAFQRDDGAAAFSYASPMIQGMFQTPDNFMLMVRNGYPSVYRPKHVQFGQIDMQEGVPTQHVLLTGPDGAEVEALYFMEREADGKWRINGCVIRPSYQA